MTNRPKKYLCQFEGCDKAYNRPALLRQHERTHTNERPFVCPEEGCGKSFFRKSHLDVHKHSHQDNDEKPFQCKICGKGAISPQLLKRHELTHTKKYKCQYESCTQAFFRFQSLKHHIDIDHKQVLTCDVCNRRFQRPVLLAEHKMKHHGDMSIEVVLCDVTGCFLTFKTDKLLQQHKKKEHPEVSCEICGEKFVGALLLETHMLAHDKQKTASLFKCKSCDGSFVTKQELTKHCRDIHENSPENGLDTTPNGATPSLETLMRNPTFDADVDEDDMQTPQRGRPKLSPAPPEDPFVSVDSMIDLVLGNNRKTYICPKENCKRKFVRHHAYVKHLDWHKIQVAEAERYLSSLERGSEPEESQLDHFSDLEEANLENEESDNSDTSEEGDAFAKKELELDQLLLMELEKYD